MLTNEVYAEQMNVITRHGSVTFLMFRLDHVRYFDGDCNRTAVLAYLINTLRVKSSRLKGVEVLKRNDLWFKCPFRTILRNFNMGKSRLRSVLAELVKTGVVEMKHRAGNVLWVRVSAEVLNKIEKGKAPEGTTSEVRKSSGSKTGFQKSDYRTSEVTESDFPLIQEPKEEKNVAGQACNGASASTSNGQSGNQRRKVKLSFFPDKSVAPKEEQFCARLAKHVRDGLKKAGKLVGNENISSWINRAGDLLAFVIDRNDFDREQAEYYLWDLFTDHLANIQDEFQPKIYCIPELKARGDKSSGILRMEDARKRRNRKGRGREDGKESTEQRLIEEVVIVDGKRITRSRWEWVE